MLCAICRDDSCACACALDCGHAFGLACTDKWIRFKTSSSSTTCPVPCPLCRHHISDRKLREVLLHAVDTLHPIYRVLYEDWD